MTSSTRAGNVKKWACVRCGLLLDSYEAFGYGSLDRPKTCCLGCKPWWVRLKMWRRDL